MYVEDNYRWFDEPFSEGTGFRRVGGQPAKQPDRAVKRDDASLNRTTAATYSPAL